MDQFGGGCTLGRALSARCQVTRTARALTTPTRHCPPPQVLAADSAYLSSVPELSAMLAAFTRAVLKDKPADLRAYAAAHFALKPEGAE